MRSSLRSVLLAAALALLTRCSKSDVVVKVGNLPKEAVTLEAMARVNGVQPDTSASFALPPQEAAPRLSFTIGLRLISPGPGEAVVAVAARDAQGCLLTSGSGSIADLDQLSSGEELLVLLRDPPPAQASQPARCLRERPALLGASEQVRSAETHRTLLLTGWAFHPDAAVTVNGSPAEGLRPLSAAEVLIDLPRISDPSGVQTFELIVTNPDGSRASITTQISQPLFNTVGTLLYRPDASSGPSFFTGLAVEDLSRN